MKAWTRKPPMTNKGPQCECGSGWLPTIMDNSRNRWACNACYGKATVPNVNRPSA